MRGLLCVLLALAAVALASRPRGVAPSDKALYQGGQFKCKDGSLTIAMSQVNDDYCDCPDGSDEPGTSACPNGSFWCKNKGFRSAFLPSWKVNDRICDCCDGSDEFDGRTHCSNTCAELDRESKKSVVAELERLKAGLEKKSSYIAAGEDALKKTAATIADLKAEIEHKREEVKQKEDKKQKAEESERDAREARRLKEEEEKAAHEAAHPTPSPPAPADAAPQEELVLDAELHHGDGAHDDAPFDEAHNDGSGDAPAPAPEAPIESPPPPPVEPPVPAFQPSEELKELKAEEQKSVDDTRRARDAWNDASSKLRDLESKLEKAEKLLTLDLGPQREFYALYDKSFTTQIEHYKYELKPFDEVNQGHTNMGKWASWSAPHTKMSYTGGQGCWQGPARSCEVTLVCGEKEEILEVKEPNKCEYAMKFATPAACNEADVQRLERQLQTTEGDDE